MEKNCGKISVSAAGVQLVIKFWANNIYRVKKTINSQFSSAKSLILDGSCSNVENFNRTETEAEIRIETDILRLCIEKSTLKVSAYSTAGHLILNENGHQFHPRSENPNAGHSIRQEFSWKKGETLHGLGQIEEGVMNYRGHSVDLWQTNTRAAVPLLVSSEGYGILWHNYSYTKFADEGGHSYLWSEVSFEIDYFFIYGPEIDEIISGYRLLTGKAPLFGKYAYGFWQSKERYKNTAELLQIAQKFKVLDFPVDVIMQDWQYWEGHQWGQKSFDPKRYPDPKALIDRLHTEWGVHFGISLWPKLDPTSADFLEMRKHDGYLYDGPHVREPFYDAFNEEARKLFWNQISRELLSSGVDIWWSDGTEPAIANNLWKREFFYQRMNPVIGPPAMYLNLYSYMHSKGLYEHQRASTDEKRIIILTRSAFLGQQKYGSITRSGDTVASWKTLAYQIIAGLNFSLSGIPYWSHDIGGYFTTTYPLGNKSTAYRELYVRWFQFGAFTPIFRSHGTNTAREPWNFGKPHTKFYRALKKITQLRYRLMPYIYSLAWKIKKEDYTLMRALIFDFHHDPNVYEISDQYCFGPSLMACPIIKPRTNLRKVYLPSLPQGSGQWFNFWTGQVYDSGTIIKIPAPLDQIPLFVPAGSILPMGQFITRASQPTEYLEIRIYPGADAVFTLYNDEGESYNYENAIYCEVNLEWKDLEQILIISDRNGSYPGMKDELKINVVLVDLKNGIGLEETENANITVEYSGKRQKIHVTANSPGN